MNYYAWKRNAWLAGSKILPKALHFCCPARKSGTHLEKGLVSALDSGTPLEFIACGCLWSSLAVDGCNCLGIPEVILALFSPCLVTLGLPSAFFRDFLESPSSFFLVALSVCPSKKQLQLKLAEPTCRWWQKFWKLSKCGTSGLNRSHTGEETDAVV